MDDVNDFPGLLKELSELSEQIERIVRAGWNSIGPERKIMRAKLREFKKSADKGARLIKTLAVLMVLWPFALISICTYSTPRRAITVIPIIALAPLLVMAVWIATKPFALIGAALIERVPSDAEMLRFKIGEMASLLRKAARAILLYWFIGDLITGAFCAFVPLSKDPGLVPVFLLIVIAILALRFFKIKGPIKAVLYLILFVLVIIFLFGGRDKVQNDVSGTINGTKGLVSGLAEMPKTSPSPAVSSQVFQRAICDSAWRDDMQEPPGNNFVVTTHAGCFREFITLPEGWTNWNLEFEGNNRNQWYAIWFAGARNPEGPFKVGSRPSFPSHPRTFRLQGTEGGQLRFYTSDDRTELTVPTPSPIRGVVLEPTALTQARAFCTPEARAANFSGNGFVSLIVTENGDVRDVKIAKSTGIASLDRNILQAAEKYRFRPATEDGTPVAFQISDLQINLLEDPCKLVPLD